MSLEPDRFSTSATTDANRRQKRRPAFAIGDTLGVSFDHLVGLLMAADRLKLEGTVSKRQDAPYRSGKQCGWVKIKCETWRAANKERLRLFECRR